MNLGSDLRLAWRLDQKNMAQSAFVVRYLATLILMNEKQRTHALNFNSKVVINTHKARNPLTYPDFLPYR